MIEFDLEARIGGVESKLDRLLRMQQETAEDTPSYGRFPFAIQMTAGATNALSAQIGTPARGRIWCVRYVMVTSNAAVTAGSNLSLYRGASAGFPPTGWSTFNMNANGLQSNLVFLTPIPASSSTNIGPETIGMDELVVLDTDQLVIMLSVLGTTAATVFGTVDWIDLPHPSLRGRDRAVFTV